MNKLPIFEKFHSGNINFKDSRKDFTRLFFYLYLLGVYLFFAILLLRLFHLTVVKGEYFRRLSEENRIKELIIEAKRGRILDRKGFVVVSNSDPDIDSNKERIISERQYQEGEVIAHLVGYRQIADKNDLKNDNCLNKLKFGDKIGKKGIEQLFECDLRGRSGKKLVEVDAHGKYLRTLSLIPAETGADIQLAFDLVLQKRAYELIKGKKGAIVAIKPQTGEIILLVSSPSFDPQTFEEARGQEIKQYFTDESKPLFNRALNGTYPPGSTFKPFIAIAAVEENKINATTQFEDTGIITAGPKSFGNWYFLEHGKTEGMVDIVKALKRSNDIFFYKTGGLLGSDLIKAYARKFGFGGKSGIELEESEGIVPSLFWKEETLQEKWYLGDTYNMAIGQGYLLVTPLQLARASASLTNEGYLCKPQLLKIDIISGPVSSCQKLPLSQKTLALVKQGMTEACQPGGTGWPFFDFKVNGNKVNVACKTGTAESNAKSNLPHAWFTVAAPAEKPEIVLVVLLEEGGQGSDNASPIAKEILRAYFERSF